MDSLASYRVGRFMVYATGIRYANGHCVALSIRRRVLREALLDYLSASTRVGFHLQRACLPQKRQRKNPLIRHRSKRIARHRRRANTDRFKAIGLTLISDSLDVRADAA